MPLYRRTDNADSIYRDLTQTAIIRQLLSSNLQPLTALSAGWEEDDKYLGMSGWFWRSVSSHINWAYEILGLEKSASQQKRLLLAMKYNFGSLIVKWFQMISSDYFCMYVCMYVISNTEKTIHCSPLTWQVPWLTTAACQCNSFLTANKTWGAKIWGEVIFLANIWL